MEAKFLLFLLQISLIEIRERSYETNDKFTFDLCDLLYNIPLQLTTEQDSKEAYSYLLANIRELKREKWIENRLSDFYDLFPEFKPSNKNAL